MQFLKPFNLRSWIDEHRHLLKPPVGNKRIFRDGEFIIMVVGGPNARKDFHVDPGEEFFHQLEGDMLLKTVQDGRVVDVPIREGEILLLPAGVPHSPRRTANTVGLVIERERRAGEQDGFQWYCENCGNLLHEEFARSRISKTQMPPLFDRFYSSDTLRTCERCGTAQSAQAEIVTGMTHDRRSTTRNGVMPPIRCAPFAITSLCLATDKAGRFCIFAAIRWVCSRSRRVRPLPGSWMTGRSLACWDTNTRAAPGFTITKC